MDDLPPLEEDISELNILDDLPDLSESDNKNFSISTLFKNKIIEKIDFTMKINIGGGLSKEFHKKTFTQLNSYYNKMNVNKKFKSNNRIISKIPNTTTNENVYIVISNFIDQYLNKFIGTIITQNSTEITQVTKKMEQIAQCRKNLSEQVNKRSFNDYLRKSNIFNDNSTTALKTNNIDDENPIKKNLINNEEANTKLKIKFKTPTNNTINLLIDEKKEFEIVDENKNTSDEELNKKKASININDEKTLDNMFKEINSDTLKFLEIVITNNSDLFNEFLAKRVKVAALGLNSTPIEEFYLNLKAINDNFNKFLLLFQKILAGVKEEIDVTNSRNNKQQNEEYLKRYIKN
jgi:hypothetical protein